MALWFLPPSGAPSAPSIFSVRSSLGKAMQTTHSQYTHSCTLPGSDPTFLLAWGGRWRHPLSMRACQRRHGCVRDSSAVTR